MNAEKAGTLISRKLAGMQPPICSPFFARDAFWSPRPSPPGKGPSPIDLVYEGGMGVRVRRMQGELLLAKARQEVLMVAEVQRQAELVATNWKDDVCAP
ncbi:MAG: hypothetical protein WCA06_00960 [Terrimicrobiaceae bacterium]